MPLLGLSPLPASATDSATLAIIESATLLLAAFGAYLLWLGLVMAGLANSQTILGASADRLLLLALRANLLGFQPRIARRTDYLPFNTIFGESRLSTVCAALFRPHQP